MSKIEGYGVYQKSLYENSVKSKKAKEEKKTDKTDKTEKNSQVELSDKAKKLLEQLRKTYGNMDFMVADYESEEEAAKYLSRGTKEYSVLIEPELLEEMASDEETKEKYLGILNDATDKLSKMKEQLGDTKDEVIHMGVSVGKDGTVSYFAELEKVSEKQRERIEKAREEKKEAAKEEEKEAAGAVGKSISGKAKKTTVKASSVEELLEKIRNVDWSTVKSGEMTESGSRFDLKV